MDAVQEVNQLIEEHRSTLSPNQLKRLRKKRGKLMQQVVHEQLNSGSQPAAKRLCLDTEAAEQQQQQQPAESSLQLSGHGPGTAAADGRDQEIASKPLAAQQQPSQHDSVHKQPPPPQQQPLQGSRHDIQRHRAAAVPTSSTSTDPCRTDLSGQLVVIQQELNSNGTAGDHSNSTFSQLLLQQHPAPTPAASDCSHGSTGTHPASTAAAVAAAAAAAAGGQPSQQQPQSRKRSRPSCQFGNYHHYYGYRLKPSGFEDPRLKVLDPSWFAGADVLDVGCNEGLVTLALAVHCGCRSVCGVDIDPVLVSKACTNLSRSRTQLNQQLHEAVRERNAQAMRPSQPVQLELPPQQQQQPSDQEQQQKTSPLGIIVASSMQPPDSKHPKQEASSSAAATAATVAGGSSTSRPLPTVHHTGLGSSDPAAGAGGASSNEQRPAQQQQQQHRKPPHAHSAHEQHQQQQQQVHRQGPKARILSAQRQIKALSRVSFRASNWLEVPCPSNKYEAITCFSVTKWIQLNWGDDGVMKLFHKFYRCLAPGGLLVLEPQPFKSYKSALHKPGVEAAPYYNLDQLKLRPEQYVEFLTQHVGFKLVQQLSAVSEAAGAEAVSVKGFDRPIIVLRKPAAGGGRGGRAAAAVGAPEGAAVTAQQQG